MKTSLYIPSISGLQYGYNSTIIAAALLFIKKDFLLTPFQEGIVVGMPMLGLWLASFSSILANYTGRKAALFCGVLFFLLGCTFSTFSPNFELLLLGRLFIGLGSGISLVVAPIYLVEIAPPKMRGRIINLNQIGIALGTLLAYILGYLLSFTENWRAMFSLGFIPAIIQGFGLFFIKESVSKEERKTILEQSSWKKALAPNYRSRMKLVILLSFFQAFSGATAIFFFAPTVFENVGFEGVEASLFSSIWIGVVYLLAICLSFVIVDRWGRRFLLIGSLTGMGLSLLLLTLSSLFQWPFLDTISLICLLSYIAFFSLGTGPIPPMIVGEISPLPIRGHAMTLMGTVGWLWNYIVATTFLPGVERIGTGGLFFIYITFCLTGAFIFLKILPETKQKTLSEIDDFFSNVKNS